ncbi:MAG: carboxypeptidase regulatory-like domain-containing protein [Acidobacteria bacterium]|nr:carboxypeptidase regulatory-like domain-containing protein [Acidobacteriota bacterium]
MTHRFNFQGGLQRALWAVLILLGLSLPASAQVDTGSIVGQVTDAAGAVVPGAKVTVREENTGITQTVIAGKAGNYTISPLKLGTYTLTAAMEGFKTAARQHIEVTIQSRLEVNMSLEVGSVTQTVQVESTAPLLETQSSSIQQLVTERAINDLPLNGRNASFLAQLSPGVTFAQNDSRGLQASGSFVANGMRRAQNNYLLDGMDNNVAIGDLVNQTQYVVMPPPDALREFTVQTSNYSAEFGHSAGAVLNVSTKSGTNRFHGNLWWFVRNDMFDARDWFAKKELGPKPKFRLNQFGGTFGGPIWHDHTFFFVDYQGTRIRQGKTYNVSVPTLAERNSSFQNLGDLISAQSASPAKKDALGRSFPVGTVFDPATTRQLSSTGFDPVTGLTLTSGANQYVRDPFYTGSVVGKTSYTDATTIAAMNQIPANRIVPAAVKLLNLFPEPNQGGASDITNNYVSNPSNINDTNQFDGRLDHTFSQKDSVFFRYSFSYNNQKNPGPFTGLADGAPNRPGNGYTEAQNGALSWTHILTSHLVNEARVGYSRVFDKRLQNGANDLSDIPFNQFGIPGIPQVNQNGGLPLFNFGQLNVLGQGAFLPSDKASNVWQATENLSIDRSRHQIRVGFEFQKVAYPMVTPSQSRGTFNYSGIYTSIVNSTDSSTDRAQFVIRPQTNSNTNPAVTVKPNYVGGANQIQATNFPAMSYPVRLYYGAYVQDSWRATQTLTFNFGLRYEFIGTPYEKNGRLANLQSAYTGDTKDGISRYYVPIDRLAEVTQNASVVNTLQANGIVITPVNDHSVGIAQKTNFAPRTGFAFQPTRKMSIRGGYGLFYQPNEDHGLSNSPWVNFPFQITNNYSGGSAFSSVATANNNTIGAIDQGLSAMSFDPTTVKGTSLAFQGEPRYPKTGYSQAYSLQVQYQILPSTIFFVGYVGSNSRHLQLTYSANTVNTINAPNVNVNTVSFFHATGNVMATGGNYMSRNGAGNYNSLQFGAERRMVNGLAFTANFTWGRCMGNNRDLLDNGVGGLRAPYVPGFGASADYARCDTDVRRIFHTSGTYELPFGKNKKFLHSGAGRWIAGGWSINWISTVQDGTPQSIACPNTVAVGLGCFATTVPGQPLYTKGDNLVRTNHFYNSAAFTIQPAVSATNPPSIYSLGGPPAQVSGPQFRKLDLSVFRRFDFIKETYFQFRGEVFNVTNTPNFAQPGTLGLNNVASFAQISGTRDNPNDPREVQLSLKYYF